MSISTIPLWQGLLKNQQAQMLKSAKSADVKAAVDYFAAKAPKVTKVDDLLRDRKLLNTVLTTYGLESDISNIGKVRQLLTQDPSDPKSLVNRLVDTRYLQFVKDLSFFQGTPAALTDPAYQAKVQQTYALNVFEKNLGNQDSSVREAAYFLRKIGGVTSVYQILADNVLRDVVTKALHLPDQFAMLDVDKQAKLLSQRLNLKDLQSQFASQTDLYGKAAADQINVQNATKLVGAASTAMTSVVGELQAIQNAYANLVPRQDPTGINGAKIATQNTTAPQLAGVRGLIDAAQARLSGSDTDIARLSQLATLASSAPDSTTLSAYQTEFAATSTRLIRNLDSATYVDPSDATQKNLLESSLSITVNTAGGSFTFSGTDLTPTVRAQLQSAQSAFAGLTYPPAVPGSIATDLANARTGAANAVTAVAQQTQLYNRAIVASDPTISTAQLGLVIRADNSSQEALGRMNQIRSKFADLGALVSTGAQSTFTGDRTALDAQVQQIKGDIERIIQTPNGGKENLLVAGTNSYGLISGTLLEIHGADLLTSIRDALKDTNVKTAANALGASNLLKGSVSDALSRAQQQITNEAGYVQGIAASGAFATTAPTQQLTLASQSAVDALSRAVQVSTLLGQLQILASSAASGSASAALDTQATQIKTNIQTLINTPGTAGLDNLLLGPKTYGFVNGTQIKLRGPDFATMVNSALAGLHLDTVGNATTALSTINNTILPNVADGSATLTSDAATLDKGRATFDPRTAIDDRLTRFSQLLPSILNGASVGSGNLLTSVADTLIFTKSRPGSYDISGHGEFDTQVAAQIRAAIASLRTTAAAPTTLLDQALTAALGISADLRGDISRVKFGTAEIDQLVTDKGQFESALAAKPYQGTKKAQSLALQYLSVAQSDTAQLTLADIMSGNTTGASGILNLLA
ncbi:MAG: flgF [Rhodospirillales bacterium]|nr:flgF [Rhodospirillales bacterium]